MGNTLGLYLHLPFGSFYFVYYEIYIDQFFVEQLLYGSILFYLALFAGKQKIRIVKILMADIIYAAAQCIYVLTGIPWLAVMGMILGVVAAFEPGRRFRGLFFLFLISLGFGGTLEAILAVFPLGIQAGSLAAIFVLAGLWKKSRRYHTAGECEAEVFLFWGETSMMFRGLVDTGNHLREPLTGRPVSILDVKCAEKLLGEGWEQQKGFFLIPYHSIGREHGWMQGITIDKMYVSTGSGQWEIRKPLFAISNERVSLRDSYQVILNPEHIKI